MIKNHSFFSRILFFLVLIVIAYSCSTEKNTFINRTYHSTTARYNGYFNAKELIRIGLEDYRRMYREDFSTILPLELLPNDDDVIEFYPVVDTAIAKCRTVISKHSMPTASKPSKKKTEFANWIDMNWLLIGQAHFIRRDYDNALETFEYIRKFYTDRTSSYKAQLWEARTQIELGMYPEAQRSLARLEAKYDIFQSDIQGKNPLLYRRKVNKLRKKGQGGELAPFFPKRLRFDIALVKTELALRRKNYDDAKIHLEEAIGKARKKQIKARLNFIMGQLLQLSEDTRAREFYTRTIKLNAPFEMSFNAKINRAMVGGKGQDAIIDELRKMLKEQKYLEYRDQVYYAMANVELTRSDREKAKYFLGRSVFYSINNDRQKGISYEKLGDITFEERNYVASQKYYDSASNVLPEDYHNYELVLNRANQLSELVKNVDIVTFEDSVQRIANMSESDREKFLEKVVEQIQEEERLRKEREAARAEQIRKLQQQQAESSGSGNKFYFSNMKAMNEGFEEFRQFWGQRENEDHWRRSTKDPVFADPDMELDPDVDIGDLEQEIFDPSTVDPRDVKPEDLTPEILMNSIPISDSAMAMSNERLIEALFRSGRIYKDQLQEVKLAAVQFQRVIDHGVESEFNVVSAFELYNINNETNTAAAGKYRDYILTNYPNTDYANYLRDPDYFIKKKEFDALALQEYLRSVERYERGLYFPVILKAENVINDEPENIFRPQYFILKAMAMGRINQDKTSLIPVLEQAIEEYPDTPIAERAAEMLKYIHDGVPAFEPFDFNKGADIFDFSYSSKMVALVLLSGEDNAREIMTKVSDFNREFFSRDRLKTSTQIYDKKTTFIKVEEFKDAKHAAQYVRDFAKTQKHLRDYRNKTVIFISPENYKVMLKDKKLEEYKSFFKDNY